MWLLIWQNCLHFRHYFHPTATTQSSSDDQSTSTQRTPPPNEDHHRLSITLQRPVNQHPTDITQRTSPNEHHHPTKTTTASQSPSNVVPSSLPHRFGLLGPIMPPILAVSGLALSPVQDNSTLSICSHVAGTTAIMC